MVSTGLLFTSEWPGNGEPIQNGVSSSKHIINEATFTPDNKSTVK
jgi:hypothetical protein